MDMDMGDAGARGIDTNADADADAASEPAAEGGASQEQNLSAQSWGLLVPCVPGIRRVFLPKSERTIHVGRVPTSHLVVPWIGASNLHAVISWNGLEDAGSEVTIEDKSKNGTYHTLKIKGERIGEGYKRILSDGTEISFGLARRPKTENEPDYRFIYRDLVSVKRELYKHYDISTQLGEGSYARVFKGLHKATSQWVAIKVIHETLRKGPHPLAANALDMNPEIRVMKELRHPNICTLREAFSNANGSIDLVLEFVEGGDLLKFIVEKNGLTEWMTCHIAQQLCQALAYIHSKGITHRDLKPESSVIGQNILLTQDSPPIVKVADFGLAKLVNSMTALRTICGTPTYIAPEIVTQKPGDQYTNLVDSWSVGVIVFAMLTSKMPFPKVPTQELKKLIEERTISWEYLDKHRTKISDDAKDFLHCLLEFEPGKRMSLAKALKHPWTTAHKPTYDLQYPDTLMEGQSLTRTASVHTADSIEPPLAHSPPTRATTEDPYACDGPPPAPLYADLAAVEAQTRALSFRRSCTPPGLTAHRRVELALERRSEVLQRAEERGVALPEPSLEMREYAESQDLERAHGASQDELYLYSGVMREPVPSLPGPAPVPSVPEPAPPAPAAVEACVSVPGGGAQKRGFSELADGEGDSAHSSAGERPTRKRGRSTRRGAIRRVCPRGRNRQARGRRRRATKRRRRGDRRARRDLSSGRAALLRIFQPQEQEQVAALQCRRSSRCF
ncbi:kinase-like domain-containing protein [Mycena sp. CBHHK59/15]|nr:kinase-like domain-containing protein [Mycena sp. CBHHK59/15]